MTEKKYERYYEPAGKASFENWDSIQTSKICGCYSCEAIFPSSELSIANTVPDAHGRTVVCPYCETDSVIGDNCGIPILKEVLKELNAYWFEA